MQSGGCYFTTLVRDRPPLLQSVSLWAREVNSSKANVEWQLGDSSVRWSVWDMGAFAVTLLFPRCFCPLWANSQALQQACTGVIHKHLYGLVSTEAGTRLQISINRFTAEISRQLLDEIGGGGYLWFTDNTLCWFCWSPGCPLSKFHIYDSDWNILRAFGWTAVKFIPDVPPPWGCIIIILAMLSIVISTCFVLSCCFFPLQICLLDFLQHKIVSSCFTGCTAVSNVHYQVITRYINLQNRKRTKMKL